MTTVRKWQGNWAYKDYNYNEEDNNGKFTLTISGMDGEINEIIRGSGSDAVGDFIIIGSREDRNFTFEKDYIGKHSLIYKGVLNKFGTKCEGKWWLKGEEEWEGNFLMFSPLSK